MTVYVADIKGRGIAAFHADNGAEAERLARDRIFRDDLMVLASNGLPLWDGVTGIQVRQALPWRRRNGGHPAPRRFASAISRGKTIHGSLFSLHSPIPTDERGGEDGQGSSGLAARGLVPIKVVFKAMVCEPTRFSNKIHGTYAMKQSTASRILVGPFGLHTFGFVVLAFFLAFLWVFNFTTFF